MCTCVYLYIYMYILSRQTDRQTDTPIKPRVPWYRRNSVHPILGGPYWALLCNGVHTGGCRMTLGTGRRGNGKKGGGGGREDRRKTEEAK